MKHESRLVCHLKLLKFLWFDPSQFNRLVNNGNFQKPDSLARIRFLKYMP
jgi:hypothetical protein